MYIFTYLVHHVKALSKEQLPFISLSLLWSINFESHPSSSVSGLYLLVPSTYIDPRMGQLVGEDLPILPLSSLLGTLFLYPVVKLTTYLAHLEAQTGLILPPGLSGEGDGRETWVLFLCYYPLPKVDVIIIKLEEVWWQKNSSIFETWYFYWNESFHQIVRKWHVRFYLFMSSSIVSKWKRMLKSFSGHLLVGQANYWEMFTLLSYLLLHKLKSHIVTCWYPIKSLGGRLVSILLW